MNSTKMFAMPELSKSGMVFDATVLSNFARIEQFHRLEPLYSKRGATTLMVVEEVQRGIEAGYSRLEVISRSLAPVGWLAVVTPETADERSLYVNLLATLGAGEASCLAVGRMRNLVVATDDRAARFKAVEQGIRVTGTLGILVRLVREGAMPLSLANELLARMIQHGYHSPVNKLGEGEAGRQPVAGD